MNLHEYQAKQLLAHYGLPVLNGIVCNSVAEIDGIVAELGQGPWVAKCQVHTGGRGKAGGVKLTNDRDELTSFVQGWLGQKIVTLQTGVEGLPVNKMLIEPALVGIKQEFYLSVLLDRRLQRIVFMASAAGGVDIETAVSDQRGVMYNVEIDPFLGPLRFQGRTLSYQLGLTATETEPFVDLFMCLVRLFLEKDLSLLEINPLAITQEGRLVCLDGKISVDNNALYRHPELQQYYDPTQEDPLEAYAIEQGLNYVCLDGNIGCLVNGAGLAMATMDVVKLHGGAPANFLDVGGGVSQKQVTEAFKIILKDKKVQGILVNIFGGIVHCDLIADGILAAIEETEMMLPVVVRLEGNNAELGAKKFMASQVNVVTAPDLTQAVKKIIEIVKEA